MAAQIDFRRRILDKVYWTFPLRKFWLALSDPEKPCPSRSRVATEIMRGEGVTDDSTLKMRVQWAESLAYCANTGKCQPPFYTYLLDLASLIRLSTRDVEG